MRAARGRTIRRLAVEQRNDQARCPISPAVQLRYLRLPQALIDRRQTDGWSYSSRRQRATPSCDLPSLWQYFLERRSRPAAAGSYSAAGLTRLLRSSLLEVMHNDYIRTARAKGLSYRRVLVFNGVLTGVPVAKVVQSGANSSS